VRRRRRHLPRHAQAGDGQAERLQLLLVEHDEAEVADIASGAIAQVCNDHFVGNIVAATAFGRSGCAASLWRTHSAFALVTLGFAASRAVLAALAAVALLATFAVAFAVAAGIGPCGGSQRAPALRQAGRQEADHQHGRAGERDRSADSCVSRRNRLGDHPAV
jgi:hypothetical protein